jgi:hypothetical protein
MSDDVGLFEVVARSPSLTEVGREIGVSVSSVSKRLAHRGSFCGDPRIAGRPGGHMVRRGC